MGIFSMRDYKQRQQTIENSKKAAARSKKVRALDKIHAILKEGETDDTPAKQQAFAKIDVLTWTDDKIDKVWNELKKLEKDFDKLKTK